MTVLNNVEYYRERREREVTLAASALDVDIRLIHLEMAERYAVLERQAMANRGLRGA